MGETGLDIRELERAVRHVGFFDQRGRDPRDNAAAWAVSNAFALDLDARFAGQTVIGQDDADAARWVEVEQLERLPRAFDHRDILRRAGVL